MTYSVVAATADGTVGGASTSCVDGFSVGIVYAARPGVGVIHAQARVNTAARDDALTFFGQGDDAATVLSAITEPSYDPLVAQRQYLLAQPDGTAAFTGAATGPFAGDRQGVVDGIQYVVAGNILTGAPVLDRTEAAFTAEGCDLAERLVRALEAGAENGEGDSRCTPDRPSTTAYLRVEGGRNDAPRIEIDIVDSLDPLAALRAQYEAWRLENPCPDASAGAGGDEQGGAPGGGGRDLGGGESEAATAPSGGAAATGDASPDPGGCALSGDSGDGSGVALVVAAVVLLGLAVRLRR